MPVLTPISRFVVISTLILGACLPGDPAKDLAIVSGCSGPVWLRVSEDAYATAATLQDTPATQLQAGAVFQSNIFDNDTDGFTIAVSGSKDVVSKIITIHHTASRSVRVLLSDARCP